MERVTLAGGCFWCTEAVFQSLKGVEKVVPGYSGGALANPTYMEVASGESGHAESVQITYDPKLISLKQLLYVFFKLHDPTQLNRQGTDVGPQYRSAIFYSNDEQRLSAESAKMEAGKNYRQPVVTEITKFTSFYPAEPEHKDFYLKNKGNSYCTLVIDPKLQKLRKEFGALIKKQVYNS